MKLCENNPQSLNDYFSHSKAKEICETIRKGNHPWITSALIAIQSINLKEGNSCLHMAIDLGNL